MTIITIHLVPSSFASMKAVFRMHKERTREHSRADYEPIEPTEGSDPWDLDQLLGPDQVTTLLSLHCYWFDFKD